jgi:hypothetical protein
MKQIVLSIIFVLLVVSGINAQNEKSVSSDAINFDNLKIKNIGLSSPLSNVLSQLGKPLKSKNSGTYPCGNTEKTLRYSGLRIKLEKDNKGNDYRVVSIEVASSAWSVSGIRIGENIENVKAKLKYRYDTTKESEIEGLHYGNGDGVASFYFRDNKLVKINWEYNWC